MTDDGIADEHSIDEARSHLIQALSAHGALPKESLPSFHEQDETLWSKENSHVESVNSAANKSLTNSEVLFLSSLLKDPKIHPKHMRRASERLLESSLFPPPRNGDDVVDVAGGASQRLPPSPRDDSLQQELFRNYERRGVRPSTVRSQLNGRSSFKVQNNSHRRRRGDRKSKGSEETPHVSGSVEASPPSVGILISDHEEGSTTEATGAELTKKTKHVVRHASCQSQGFEVMCQSSRVADSTCECELELAVEGLVGKEARQTQFHGAGQKLLSGLDKIESASLRGDASTDTSICVKAQTAGDEEHAQDGISSWDLSSDHPSDDEVCRPRPDAWDALRVEYALGYGFGYRGDDPDESESFGLSFKVLGTSAGDVSCKPRVLSPPLMESLLNFMPETATDCNYFLKYSMVRDGASIYQLLRNVRGSVRTVLAIETVDGFVFGSFTSKPWRIHREYFGSHESFVWRMRRSRFTPCHSVVEQAVMESELEVFPYTGMNNNVQLCHADRIGLGGMNGDFLRMSKDDEAFCKSNNEDHQNIGFALSFASDLTLGTTSASETFGNPCLLKPDSKGETFKVVNIEVWAMTPYNTVAEAEEDELARLFFFEEEENAGKRLNILGILMGSTMRS